MEVNQLRQYFGTWQEFLRSVFNYLQSEDKKLNTKCSRFLVATNPMLPLGRTVGDHEGPGNRTNSHSEQGSLASLEERAAWARALL